jgi:hypothetical protein
LDRTRWRELLVGLERVEVLEVARASDGRLHVAIETTDRLAACAGCGCRARVKDRDPVPLADLRVFGSPVELVVWLKRRWRCPDPVCEVGSWTEDRADINPARAAMTARAGQWATREVGAEVHTVTYGARASFDGRYEIADRLSFSLRMAMPPCLRGERAPYPRSATGAVCQAARSGATAITNGPGPDSPSIGRGGGRDPERGSS